MTEQVLVPHFICSLTDGHLGCFHFLTVMNNASMNIHIQVVHRHVFSFGGIYIYIYRTEISDHMVTLYLII